jgi:hypothetical protein
VNQNLRDAGHGHPFSSIETVVRSRRLLRSFQLVATRPLNRISKHCGIREEQSIALKKPNFRIARHPPKIVTCAELDFYDLP